MASREKAEIKEPDIPRWLQIRLLDAAGYEVRLENYRFARLPKKAKAILDELGFIKANYSAEIPRELTGLLHQYTQILDDLRTSAARMIAATMRFHVVIDLVNGIHPSLQAISVRRFQARHGKAEWTPQEVFKILPIPDDLRKDMERSIKLKAVYQRATGMNLFSVTGYLKHLLYTTAPAFDLLAAAAAKKVKSGGAPNKTKVRKAIIASLADIFEQYNAWPVNDKVLKDEVDDFPWTRKKKEFICYGLGVIGEGGPFGEEDSTCESRDAWRDRDGYYRDLLPDDKPMFRDLHPPLVPMKSNRRAVRSGAPSIEPRKKSSRNT